MATTEFIYRLLIEPDGFQVGLSNAPDGKRMRSWTPRRLPPGYTCNFATLRDAPAPAQAVRDIEPAATNLGPGQGKRTSTRAEVVNGKAAS